MIWRLSRYPVARRDITAEHKSGTHEIGFKKNIIELDYKGSDECS